MKEKIINSMNRTVPNGYIGQKDKQESRRNRKRWAIRILIAIILLLLLLLGLRMCNVITFPWEDTSPIISGELYPGDGNGEDGHLSNMTEEQIREQMQKVADKSYISFKIEGRPVFEDGNSKGNLNIENPSYNSYLMAVKIHLTDENGVKGELIYESGGLRPDQHIDNDKLAKVLSKGSYPATATMTFFDPDSGKKVGEHEAELVITIKN